MKNLFKKIREPKVLRVLLIIIISALLIGGTFYYLKSENRISIEDSTIQTPLITVSPSAPGILTTLNVHEGEKVQKGETLATVGTQTLTAYTDGLIVKVANQLGGSVGPTTPVVQMIDLDSMRVDGTIDENKGLDKLAIGQAVSFTVDALPGKTFWGYIDEISPSAKTTQAAFSISSERPTQQFDIFATFDASRYPQIKNGMSAKMIVFTKNAQ